MIPFSLSVLVLFNFVLIGLLPLLFFRRDGNFNLRWFATGAPFFLAPVAVLLSLVGWLDPAWSYADSESAIALGIATLASAVSIGLLAMTVGSHRVPLALWHQDNDAPVEIVTWGPYSRIRHPFYTSFLLAFTAAALLAPGVVTIGCLVYSFTALSVTAAREEQRLTSSEFGDEYRRYMRASGRFVPRLLS